MEVLVEFNSKPLKGYFVMETREVLIHCAGNHPISFETTDRKFDLQPSGEQIECDRVSEKTHVFENGVVEIGALKFIRKEGEQDKINQILGLKPEFQNEIPEMFGEIRLRIITSGPCVGVYEGVSSTNPFIPNELDYSHAMLKAESTSERIGIQVARERVLNSMMSNNRGKGPVPKSIYFFNHQ
jgi:hypothetical protein